MSDQKGGLNANAKTFSFNPGASSWSPTPAAAAPAAEEPTPAGNQHIGLVIWSSATTVRQFLLFAGSIVAQITQTFSQGVCACSAALSAARFPVFVAVSIAALIISCYDHATQAYAQRRQLR
jgi:hypothetical protein